MKYTVVWHPTALDALTNLWMTAADRNAVAFASDEIDRRLGRDPENEGESREAPLRIVIVSPLAANYFVSPQDRIAYVISVWKIGNRGR